MSALSAVTYVDGQTDEALASININHNLSFNVYYLENDMFEDNPVPINFNFLMSFTDYILINDSLMVTVSEPMEIRYDFNVVKRLAITSLDASSIAGEAIVFEQSAILAQGSGQDYSTFVQISSHLGLENAEDGIAVFPREHINQYMHFVEYHLQQMIREDVMALGGRNFGAELHVDFVYNIHLPSINHRESSVRSISIPLSGEVYDLAASGDTFIERIITLPRQDYVSGHEEAPPVLVYVAGVLAGLAGLTWSVLMFIKALGEKAEGKAEYEREQIIKKYSDNIIVAHNPVDFSDKTVVVLKEFKEMLKLSMWFNRPIIYCKGLRGVDFVIVDEAFVYVHNIGLKVKREQGKQNAVPIDLHAKRPKTEKPVDDLAKKLGNPPKTKGNKQYSPKRKRNEGEHIVNLQRRT